MAALCERGWLAGPCTLSSSSSRRIYSRTRHSSVDSYSRRFCCRHLLLSALESLRAEIGSRASIFSKIETEFVALPSLLLLNSVERTKRRRPGYLLASENQLPQSQSGAVYTLPPTLANRLTNTRWHRLRVFKGKGSVIKSTRSLRVSRVSSYGGENEMHCAPTGQHRTTD